MTTIRFRLFKLFAAFATGLRGRQKLSRRRILCQAILVGCIVAMANVGSAQGLWDETINGGGDAPDLQPGQMTVGSGPLMQIRGFIDNPDLDIDMYCIDINDPSNFSASVASTPPLFVSQLFLFDSAGNGVAHHVNLIGPTTTISNQFVSTPGKYLLAISRPDLDPLDGVGLGAVDLFIPNNPATEVGVNPLAGPLANWIDQTSGSGSFGPYLINLTGTTYCGVPEPSCIALLCWGLGVLGIQIRRRV